MRSAYDLKHPKGTKAVALLLDGKHAGNIVANYSDNPNGSTVTTTASIWDGPLNTTDHKQTASAGGYGYDKFASCLEQLFPKPGTGYSFSASWKSALECYGYTVLEVL